MDIDFFNGKDAYIFDVDGTLYSQKKMRVLMAKRLIKHGLFSIGGARDILYIYTFRSYREKTEYKENTIEELCSIIASKYKSPYQTVFNCIEYWMLVEPLKIIKECQYKSIAELIDSLQQAGKRIYFYSDYPLEDKLAALGMSWTDIFFPDGEKITELKPSRAAMEYIVGCIGCDKDAIIMIGDRDDRDGESAKTIGMDYCNVREMLNK